MKVWPWNNDGEWTCGNDTPTWTKRNVWFIYRRDAAGTVEYLNDRRGRLRTWRSGDAVIRALEKLTGKPAAVVT